MLPFRRGSFLAVFVSILMLHTEQKVAVHREGPVFGGGERLQLIGGFTGLGHAGDDMCMAVFHGLFGIGGNLGHILLKLVTGVQQRVREL